MRSGLPSGTVTFLFTDVEGSTKLLDELGAEAYADALAEHRRIVREASAAHGGVEVDTQGDAFFFAFPTAPGAVEAARAMTERLDAGPICVRIGLHTGSPLLTDEGYVGPDVHRAARIANAGHGGQVLVSASTASLVEHDLRNLGEHRLKDLSAPERICQLGQHEFPRLKTLFQTNLPIPSTPFLGREKELAEVLALLMRRDVRLLTLTGPGGTGKTRLAAQAAGLASDAYPDGVWWVPLAALRDSQLVLERAAQVLGATNGLREHIRSKQLLVLFDNFEQVVEASADLAELLAACPALKLVVTSREPLHVTGEQEYPVSPFVHEEGVGFFIARARAVEPDFHPDDAVSEICRRLDELPLALELAAARVKALSSAQILARLEQRLGLLTGGATDLPERQRTLRATIEWSYEMLRPEERRLFARLAIFRGGCLLEAAEEIVETDLDTLQSLVDKSLVRHREDRFWMLETIREYAAEVLEASGDSEMLGRRHSEHFLALAEVAEPHLRGSPKEWLDRLEEEHDNLRAALGRLEASGEGELVLRLAGAMTRFWYMRGYWTEGRRRLEGALAGDERPSAARGKALTGAAAMAVNTGDAAAARMRAEEALALQSELADASGIAYSVFMLGMALRMERDFARAQSLYEESVRRFRELGDEHFALLATENLASMCDALGEHERAGALLEDNLRRARAMSNRRIEAASLSRLAAHARDEGRIEDALSMLHDAYRISRDVGEPLEVADILNRFASVLAVAGRARTGARLLSRAESTYEEFGATSFPSWLEDRKEETLTAVRLQLDEAAFAEAWDEGRTLSADEAVELALRSEAH